MTMCRFLKSLGFALATGLALAFVSGCHTHCGACAEKKRPAAVLAPTAAPALPETCYLFAYFYHAEEAEGFRLAWSADGQRFEKLNEGKSYLKPAAGENKLMRDPHLYRSPDGVFHLVWTTGWTGKTIGYASSKDLIHWSEQKTLPVMAHESEAQNCWAPEIVWDPA